MKYADKLKDPRWQKKRLKILERDNWTCRGCSDAKNTLAVHHLKYFPDKEPWECPDKFLLTLCEECHRQEREHRPFVEQAMLEFLQENGFLCGDLGVLNWGISRHPEALRKHLSLLEDLQYLEAALAHARAKDKNGRVQEELSSLEQFEMALAEKKAKYEKLNPPGHFDEILARARKRAKGLACATSEAPR